MIVIKQNLIFHFLILSYTLSLSSAIECKACVKGRPSCLFGDADTRQCENDDDLCYSWFYRTSKEVGVQRDCISTSSSAYSLIKKLISDKDTGCVKRTRELDCFTFCSTDLCN